MCLVFPGGGRHRSSASSAAERSPGYDTPPRPSTTLHRLAAEITAAIDSVRRASARLERNEACLLAALHRRRAQDALASSSFADLVHELLQMAPRTAQHICHAHHRHGVHQGRLAVAGRAPDDLTWDMPWGRFQGDRRVRS